MVPNLDSLNNEVRYYPEGLFSSELDESRVAIPEWFVRETWLINEALDRGVNLPSEVINYGPTKFELSAIMAASVDVTYFVEAPREWVDPEKRGAYLLDLFQSPMPNGDTYYGFRSFNEMELAEVLAQTGSSVAIALSTLDESTAHAIRYLNQKGVKVVGWVVLEDSDGYWTNAGSLEATNSKVAEIISWKDEYALFFDRIGIDLELPLPVVASLSQMKIFRAVNEWFRYRVDVETQAKLLQMKPQERFEKILGVIKSEGYEMEYYAAPKVSQLLLSAGVQQPVGSRVIDMAYTSEVPRVLLDLGFDAGKLVSHNSIPDIGIVNGIDGETPGRDFGYLLDDNSEGGRKKSSVRHLDLSQIERDILSVMKGRVDFGERRTLEELYIFALNASIVAQLVILALDRAFATGAANFGQDNKKNRMRF